VRRGLFGPERDKKAGKIYTLRNYIICTFYEMLLKMIISRGVGWVGYVALIGEIKNMNVM
jgi:hypothetical protein